MLNSKACCMREGGTADCSSSSAGRNLGNTNAMLRAEPWSLTLTTAVGCRAFRNEHGSEASSCLTARSAIGHRHKILPIQWKKHLTLAQLKQPKCGRKADMGKCQNSASLECRTGTQCVGKDEPKGAAGAGAPTKTLC